uniref:Tetratricopeptide repeat-containing protein n=1 Tax=Candidatus Kentrum sp. FM TaxID=2126340 RepID=A0A450TMA0_9GAMM|nr:MAG: hypothetical protein BECKFM1743C_GA0114222_105021 [Candidatus Kentron sp. FM]VFJ73281.1 MAG: hypothetical protein BECKFM1743A_GA0114220_107061 [Candidatus Kentron sp. FM]VFK16153.1 MAG: hypothetical protein BECKFM1743B_GA0114221_104051 [Candidatus Kentron sp. FM]
MPNPAYDRLPEHVKDDIERLYEQIWTKPRKAIPGLLEWIEKYPDVPTLYNYLTAAYSQSGQRKKTREVIEKNYQRNPDYLFARLNYANLCIRDGDYGKVGEIFEHKFDLKLLYPQRKRFHVTEVAGFMSTTGTYFFYAGKRESAEKCYELLEQIERNYPESGKTIEAQVTQLRWRLYPKTLWQRFMVWLSSRNQSAQGSDMQPS